MAKKLGQVPSGEPKLKSLIRDYIIQIGELGEDLSKKNPTLEFGFLFFHPKGFTKQPNGKIIYRGRSFQANKPKKENFIVISHLTRIDKSQVEIIEKSQKVKDKLYNDLRKIFLLKNIEYDMHLDKNEFILFNRIYPEKDGKISIENFYNTLRNLFHADIYAIILINEQLSGKIDTGEDSFRSPYHI